MHTIFIAMGLLLLWLVFPKGLTLMVGGLVGTAVSGFVWSLFMGVLLCSGIAFGSHFMGWSFLGFIIAGNIVGCSWALQQ